MYRGEISEATASGAALAYRTDFLRFDINGAGAADHFSRDFVLHKAGVRISCTLHQRNASRLQQHPMKSQGSQDTESHSTEHRLIV